MTNFKNIYEFLLWANCNNNCTFCHQRLFAKNGRILSSEEKLDSINKTLEYINSSKFVKGSHIMLCGGELFDNIKDKNKLLYLFEGIKLALDKNLIDIIYLNTNLIYEKPIILLECLSILENSGYLHHINFTTSFDLKGRFKTKEKLHLFEKNFKLLDDEFPGLNRITNIIMTKDVCEAIINKVFSLKEFSLKYNTHINLIPYIKLVDSLAPTKDEIIDTLKEADKQLPNYLYNYKINLNSNPKRYVFEYIKDKGFINSGAELSSCGHSINFTKVFSNNACFICELNKIL